MTVFEDAEARFTDAQERELLGGARRTPYWLENTSRPAARRPLAEDARCDLVVVGGGYTGLWTALLAKERDPERDVVLLEAKRIGWAASGRNGGFCEASLTHGASNGIRRLPDEYERLAELGQQNLDQLAETVSRYAMDCDFQMSGVLRTATEPHQVEWLRTAARDDAHARFLSAEDLAAEVCSPLYQAGLFESQGTAIVHPAKLAWELARVCEELGVRIFEGTLVERIVADAGAVSVKTPGGVVRAQRVALGTNVFPSLIRKERKYTIPLYDYALMSNPLSEQQAAQLGWAAQYGITDLNNRFHYSRLTTDADGRLRILYGGYDAIYHYGGRVKPQYDQRDASFRRLAAHFAATYPYLADLGFSHKWGGAIDTCSRFFPFFATQHDGRVAHTAGFTGLGVGATRFAAGVMVDLLDGRSTELTRMDYVTKKPLPFPPDPFAFVGARLSYSEMARADRHEGKRGLWLRTMDAVGLGFDS
ncbi:NAD(P)/FAD-dependent oxidoreductase [Pseudoclavibacter sp. CFCC 11306]|uniref:NAD(P)/FAD-dependent oxidoreductase n=1 Tax=Pseudoclavibacter sp. CFCC 11306 TaxID=1564493 RepID=UPI0013015615|nr:FAD-dependent oxidoreductase [Pseudoclavibacter sp. CFCC 11306]KAB1659202.1 FAD-dependent oxidoreductase [Pseudoclavibacter sp. CFCC 11306]